MRVHCVVPDAFAPALIRELRGLGSAVRVTSRSPGRGPLLPAETRGVDVLVVSGIAVPASALNADPPRLVQKWGNGVDEIDVAGVTGAGASVANVPRGNTVAVAEHFFALLLALARQIVPGATAARGPAWPQREIIERGLTDLHGRTLGLVGLGAIGREVAVRARAFGMRVRYHKPRPAPEDVERRLDVRYLGRIELAETSDVLGLTAALTPSSRRFVDRALLSRVRPGTLLVNVARGGLVEEGALLEALDAGRVAGFATDVLDREPFENRALLDRPDVLATPHVAGRSRDAIDRMNRFCRDNAERVLEGRAHDVEGLVT